MAAVRGYQSKQYTCDFVPLQQGKNHIFGKWDFKITQEDTRINLRVSFPSDKYLQDYVRLKLIEKGADIHQAAKFQTYHTCYLENLSLPISEEGYILLIEGCMPYNTTEGQL